MTKHKGEGNYARHGHGTLGKKMCACGFALRTRHEVRDGRCSRCKKLSRRGQPL